MKVVYLTDTEGRWEKLEGFCQENPWVSLEGERIILAEGVKLIFGGDAVDRGPGALRLLRCLVEAFDRYSGRVVLIAGNRDLNKLRLPRELGGHPRMGAPLGSRSEILRWTLEKTMGAGQAFEARRAELGGVHDEEVVDSFLEEVSPEGALLAFLRRARLGWREEETLVVHGAVTPENYGVVPGKSLHGSLSDWLSSLQDFYLRNLRAYEHNPLGDGHAALIDYQAPLPKTRANQQSVVYGRLANPDGNPRLPLPALRTMLQKEGICRLVVGHTPAGDCPAVLREDGFELLVADNSYGRLERGSQVRWEGENTFLRGWVDLGGPAEVLAEGGPFANGRIGRHAGEGFLVKGQLKSGLFHGFRFLPGFVADEVAMR